ncbi:hypothetical protein TIFTF001_055070, partial [Ficus carica]
MHVPGAQLEEITQAFDPIVIRGHDTGSCGLFSNVLFAALYLPCLRCSRDRISVPEHARRSPPAHGRLHV